MALRGSRDNPNIIPKFTTDREPPHQVLHEIRQGLQKKGIYGIRAFVNLFKEYGGKDGQLGRHETKWVLKHSGL